METIMLPLSTLNPFSLDWRSRAFRACHGHLPGEKTTLREWVTAAKPWAMFRIGDMLWAAQHAGSAGQRLAVVVAVKAAQRALPIHEEMFPEDRRPQQAIAAVQRWLAGEQVTEDLRCSAADVGAFHSIAVGAAALAAAAAIDPNAYEAGFAAEAAANTVARGLAINAKIAEMAKIRSSGGMDPIIAINRIDAATNAAAKAEREQQCADFLAELDAIEGLVIA